MQGHGKNKAGSRQDRGRIKVKSRQNARTCVGYTISESSPEAQENVSPVSRKKTKRIRIVDSRGTEKTNKSTELYCRIIPAEVWKGTKKYAVSQRDHSELRSTICFIFVNNSTELIILKNQKQTAKKSDSLLRCTQPVLCRMRS